jgi:hypothetical protein
VPRFPQQRSRQAMFSLRRFIFCESPAHACPHGRMFLREPAELQKPIPAFNRHCWRSRLNVFRDKSGVARALPVIW